MIDTTEAGGGSYPSPDELEDEEIPTQDYETYLEELNDDARAGL